MSEYKIVNYCPHCNAPIYELRHDENTTAPIPPQIIFNCDCRNKIYVYPYIIPYYPNLPYEITLVTDGTYTKEIDYTVTGSTDINNDYQSNMNLSNWVFT